LVNVAQSRERVKLAQPSKKMNKTHLDSAMEDIKSIRDSLQAKRNQKTRKQPERCLCQAVLDATPSISLIDLFSAIPQEIFMEIIRWADVSSVGALFCVRCEP
jgi:hypothetical protein